MTVAANRSAEQQLKVVVDAGSGPSKIGFMIGDTCNAQCLMCWQAWRRKNRPGERWPDLPARIVLETIRRHGSDLYTTEFVSFGETLLHPEFQAMLDSVRALRNQHGRVALNLITNGALLGRFADDLAALPGGLAVSLDAADPAVYAATRRGLRLQDVRAACAKAIFSPHRHKNREFWINAAIRSDTVDQIPLLAALAVADCFDALVLIRAAALENTDAAGRELPADDPRLACWVAEVRVKFPGLQVVDYLSPPPKRSTPCQIPWNSYDIDPKGRAHPCCRAYETDLGSWDSDVWNGEPLRALRTQLAAGRVDPVRFGPCAGCDQRGSAG